MRKKGQAAMEFLMTYGWAILVVLAAIAALAYFGVLSPDRFLPNKCQLPSGFGCVDFVANSNGETITLVLQNGAGFDAIVEGINITHCNQQTKTTLNEGSTTGPDILVQTPPLWKNGDKAFAQFDCEAGNMTSGTKYQGEITIYYNTTNGLQKTAIGDLVTKAE